MLRFCRYDTDCPLPEKQFGCDVGKGKCVFGGLGIPCKENIHITCQVFGVPENSKYTTCYDGVCKRGSTGILCDNDTDCPPPPPPPPPLEPQPPLPPL